jgi:hypothetical protein
MKRRRETFPTKLRIVAIGLVLGASALAKAKHRVKDRPPEFPVGAAESKACRTAALDEQACFAELAQLGVHFRKAGPAPGVRTPIRLTGPVLGVTYRTDFPDAARETSPFEVLDCRLAVALADLSPILREHAIEEVRLFSAWRPAGKAVSAGSVATAHPGGLAADLRLFKKSGGGELDVESDFHGRIGALPCGPGSVPPAPATEGAHELRSILCAIADARLFHVLLSPNFDVRHRNHFHVEVRPEVRWFIVR